MTYDEIKLIIQKHNEKLKLEVEMKKREQEAKASEIYATASLTAQFILQLYGGKPIPSLEEVFPALAEEVPEEEKINGLTKAEFNRMMLYKEQMIDFANQRNKLLKGR